MAETILNKAAREIIPSGSINTAGSATHGAIDMRTSIGGLLTLKITNGATAPTTQCEARVMIAHENGATPAYESPQWKTIFKTGNGLAPNAVGEWSVVIDDAVMHLQIVFAGNSVQPATVEAYLSEVVSTVTN